MKLPEKFLKYLQNVKYPALVLVLGLLLVLLPGKREKEQPEEVAVLPVPVQEATLEERLETVLMQVEGAGKVRVLLSVLEGETALYQTDTVTEEGRRQTETVLAEGRPIPTATLGPVYQGAVVVAEGAGSAPVRLALTEAVMSLTGLGADKITVIKMKMN